MCWRSWCSPSLQPKLLSHLRTLTSCYNCSLDTWPAVHFPYVAGSRWNNGNLLCSFLLGVQLRRVAPQLYAKNLTPSLGRGQGVGSYG